MTKILRALLISATATGVVLIATALLSGRPLQVVTPQPRRPEDPAEMDADEIGADEADLLMKELGAQL